MLNSKQEKKIRKFYEITNASKENERQFFSEIPM
jgi:hypothetical protein